MYIKNIAILFKRLRANLVTFETSWRWYKFLVFLKYINEWFLSNIFSSLVHVIHLRLLWVWKHTTHDKSDWKPPKSYKFKNCLGLEQNFPNLRPSFAELECKKQNAAERSIYALWNKHWTCVTRPKEYQSKFENLTIVFLLHYKIPEFCTQGREISVLAAFFIPKARNVV